MPAAKKDKLLGEKIMLLGTVLEVFEEARVKLRAEAGGSGSEVKKVSLARLGWVGGGGRECASVWSSCLASMKIWVQIHRTQGRSWMKCYLCDAKQGKVDSWKLEGQLV